MKQEVQLKPNQQSSNVNVQSDTETYAPKKMNFSTISLLDASFVSSRFFSSHKRFGIFLDDKENVDVFYSIPVEFRNSTYAALWKLKDFAQLMMLNNWKLYALQIRTFSIDILAH